MDPTLKICLKAVGFLILVAIIQAISLYIVGAVYAVSSDTPFEEVMHVVSTQGWELANEVIIPSTILGHIITIPCFLLAKWTPISTHYISKKPYQLLGLIVLFSLFIVLPLAGIYEWTGLELSKDIQKLFNAIMQKPFGIVVVAILAPIVEEIVFRGAILRLLLECFSGKKAWIAIVISAVAFGLFHGNLAQAVNASFLGLILGWLYYRTKSIVPSMVLHLVNNVSTVVMTLAFSSNPDIKVIEMFGNNLPLAVGCLTVSALLAIGTFLLIRKRI